MTGPATDDNGFSLIEVLVAFAILALGLSVAVESIALVSKRSRSAAELERATERLLLGSVGAREASEDADDQDAVAPLVHNGRLVGVEARTRVGSRTIHLRHPVPPRAAAR